MTYCQQEQIVVVFVFVVVVIPLPLYAFSESAARLEGGCALPAVIPRVEYALPAVYQGSGVVLGMTGYSLTLAGMLLVNFRALRRQRSQRAQLSISVTSIHTTRYVGRNRASLIKPSPKGHFTIFRDKSVFLVENPPAKERKQQQQQQQQQESRGKNEKKTKQHVLCIR